MIARRLSIAGLVLVVLLGACGTAEKADPDLASVGPHATPASTRIVYAEDAAPLGLAFGSFEAGWSGLAESVDGVVALREDDREGTQTMYVAESESSGIALDLVVESGVILVAQLAVVDAAGDEDEPHVLAVVEGFLDLIEVDFDASRLELSQEEPLFAEREVSVIESPTTVYMASNEDSILVGAVGTS